MTSESLGSTCRDKYSITVAKILMSRIEGKHIKNILEACKSSDTDWQIIYLIRDPRAVIPSSQSVGFFSNRGSPLSKNGLRLFSYQKCSQTEENLVFLKNIPISWRRRIRRFCNKPNKGDVSPVQLCRATCAGQRENMVQQINTPGADPRENEDGGSPSLLQSR